MTRNIVPSGAKVWENSVVPPGLESFVPFFPALARWAKLVRPSGAGFSGILPHQFACLAVICSGRVTEFEER
jgi:hypothetical protein